MSSRQPTIHTPRRCAPFGSDAVMLKTEWLSGRIAWVTASGVCCPCPCTRHVMLLLLLLLLLSLPLLLLSVSFSSCRYVGVARVARAVQEHQMAVVCECAPALNPRRAEQDCLLCWLVRLRVRARCGQTGVGPMCARPRAGAVHTTKFGLLLLLLLCSLMCVIVFVSHVYHCSRCNDCCWCFCGNRQLSLVGRALAQ